MGTVSRSPHTAVMGLQFGDEGKGQLVDLLCAEHDIVVRYNGGANAGHSVRIGDEKFAVHLLPSGILSPATLNVIANGVVVDPFGLLAEIDGLLERGVPVGENLRLSDRAHLVLPYHQREDALRDAVVARLRGERQAIGTTGRGIGPAYADKCHRATAIRAGELRDPAALRDKLRLVVTVKNATLAALCGLLDEPFEPFDADALAADLTAAAERLTPLLADTGQLLREASAAGQRILFEGANAALLDVDHGTYPFVTSSSTTALGIASGAGVPARFVGSIRGVVKAYTSRVGGGPFPTELHDETAAAIRERGGEFGTTTGRPRRIGWLDLVATGYTAALTGVDELCLTGLSVLSGVPRLRVCTGYLVDGQRLDEFPADGATLARVTPEYVELEGYSEPLEGCGSYAELPAAARRLIDLIEERVAPVRFICVGRRRDQVVEKG